MRINSFFLLLSVFCCLIEVGYAQADLQVVAIGTPSDSIPRGSRFQLQFDVVNTGDTTSPASYAVVYLSDDEVLQQKEVLSRVSIRELKPNERQRVNFLYPISTFLSSGEYFPLVELDPYDQIEERNEDNVFCLSGNEGCKTINLRTDSLNLVSQVYPILFIHGFTDKSDTWGEFEKEVESFFGWTYGGRLDFSLNPDDNVHTSDGYVLSFTPPSELAVADYYTINFDVGSDGTPFVSEGNKPTAYNQSNSSAIHKQGLAVKEAIADILTVTGADKIVLIGHSMGGLAAREYLQNEINWQPDGRHHVAKVLSIATPHGGSNLKGGFIATLLGKDESSEAVRDLRHRTNLFNGLYLDGGVESEDYSYYNNDINCNGHLGDTIIGLNHKTAPTDVLYSCIIGEMEIPFPNLLPGDGVVTSKRADLNDYLIPSTPEHIFKVDTFIVASAHTDVHTDNPSTIIQGLDEPNYYNRAYPVHLNTFMYGYSTLPAGNNILSGAGIDYDWYSFTLPESGNLYIPLNNISVNEFRATLYDRNLTSIQIEDSGGKSNFSMVERLPAGEYFIEVKSNPDFHSWRHPYTFSLDFVPHVKLPETSSLD